MIRVGYRYAKAFFEEAHARGDLDGVMSDMSTIADIVNRDSLLKRVIKDPSLTSEKKLSVLEEIFSKHLNKSTLLFLKFLATKKRIAIIEDIAKQFEVIHRKAQKIVELLVTLSDGLDENFGNQLVNKLSEVTGKKFEVTLKYDKNLIGGFIYAYEGSVFDYSIKGKLNALSKELK